MTFDGNLGVELPHPPNKTCTCWGLRRQKKINRHMLEFRKPMPLLGTSHQNQCRQLLPENEEHVGNPRIYPGVSWEIKIMMNRKFPGKQHWYLQAGSFTKNGGVHVGNFRRKSMHMLGSSRKIDAHVGTSPKNHCTCWNFPEKSMHMLELLRKLEAPDGLGRIDFWDWRWPGRRQSLFAIVSV